MQIIENGLQFNGLQARSKTDLIVVHHSASADVPAAEIHAWHLVRGWAGIGYHFVIRNDGSIERGRPQDMIGAHAGAGVNDHSIGICLCGNFMQDQPSEPQLVSLIELVIWLKKYYGVSVGSFDIKLHRQVAATECPGKLFPEKQFINRLRLALDDKGELNMDEWKLEVMQMAQAAGLIKEAHHPDDPASKWFVLQVALNALGKIKNGGKALEG